MTRDEAMRHIRERTPLDNVRSVLSGIIAEAEQAGMQRHAPTPVDMRVNEFRAVEKLLDAAEAAGLIARLEAEEPKP